MAQLTQQVRQQPEDPGTKPVRNQKNSSYVTLIVSVKIPFNVTNSIEHNIIFTSRFCRKNCSTALVPTVEKTNVLTGWVVSLNYRQLDQPPGGTISAISIFLNIKSSLETDMHLTQMNLCHGGGHCTAGFEINTHVAKTDAHIDR